MKSRHLVYLIFIITIVKDSLTGYPYFLEYNIRYVDDVLLLILYLKLLYDGKHKDNHLLKFIIVIISYSILHSFITKNGLDLLKYSFVFSLRDIFWYYPIYLYFKNYRTDFNKLCILFVYIQIGFVLFQFLFHLITTGSILFEDLVTGTIGENGSHKLGYALMLTIPSLVKKDKKFLIVMAHVLLLLASARSIIVIYLAVSAIYGIFLIKGLKTKIYVVTLFALFLIPSFYIYNNYTNTTLDLKTIIYQQQLSLEEGSGARRVSFTIYIFNKLNNDDRLLFGGGSASFASRSASVIDGYYYKEYLRDFPYKNEYISGGGMINVFISEFGLIGLFYFGIMFFSILNKIYIIDRVTFIYVLIFVIGLMVQKLLEDYSNAFLFFGIVGNSFYYLEKRNEY